MQELDVSSDFSGVGAFDQALRRLYVNYNKSCVCDMNKWSRRTYIFNYGTEEDKILLEDEDVKFIDDIYFRGIVDSNSKNKPSKEDWEKVDEIHEKTARRFSFYYPWDVYKRTINEHPVDIYMTSPPCQAFSLAGKRLGKDDLRGVLFFNSLEFIEVNNPRFFIFENVKGLLSDDGGKTFSEWINFLGGKSINGNMNLFPIEGAVDYHIYHKVLNAKKHGVPQNRERVFIIGIRDDSDNNFSFPKEEELKKNLKNILEEDVDDKYFLSNRMIKGFLSKNEGFKGRFNPKGLNDKSANCITTRTGSNVTDNYIKVGFVNNDTQAGQVFDENGVSPNLCAGTHGYANGYVKIGVIRGRNPDNPKSRKSGLKTEQMLEINESGTSNALTTVQKDNVVVKGTFDGFRIRRLTPRECFRLMDFPEDFIIDAVSDTQLYRQAGNSIVVRPLQKLINNLINK